MDSFKSQWNKFVLSENILDTTKMFFEKYHYRAEMNVSGASHIRTAISRYQSYSKFKSHIDIIKESAQSRYRDQNVGSWYKKTLQHQIDMNAFQLWEIAKACEQHKGNIRTRAEKGKFAIYTETEVQLIDIIMSAKKYIVPHLTTIHRPANDKAKLRLEDKVIFVNKPKHNFKVLVKEHSCPNDTKKQILAYLNNFNNDVTLPFSLERSLKDEKHNWMRGHYYYVNDLSMLTFLQMISPKFVNKIFKLEQMEE